MSQKVIIKSYNSKFQTYFGKEKKIIIEKIGNVEIHHIGSTAVAGLGGKNILDILVLVSTKKNMIHIKKKLESIGYEFSEMGGDAQRIFFNKDTLFSKKKIHIHLHLMRKSLRKYKDYLIFRDYLIKYPEEARKYYALKKIIIKKVNSIGVKYRDSKANYIKKVIKKAKADKK